MPTAPPHPWAGSGTFARAGALPLSLAVACAAGGCDRPPPGAAAEIASEAALPAAPGPSSSLSSSPPSEPQAPEIIVDRAHVDVGKNRVSTDEPHVGDRAAVFLRGAPGFAGRTVDVVVLRAVKPSLAVQVFDALHRAGATGLRVKTEARDATTQSLPVAFAVGLPDCAPVAWIAKDAAVDVWPAGGGRAKRVPRGLAGPDLTLGMEAFEKLSESCETPAFAVGADDAMTWGLVFDVAFAALHQNWTRAGAAAVVGDAVPGRRLVIR